MKWALQFKNVSELYNQDGNHAEWKLEQYTSKKQVVIPLYSSDLAIDDVYQNSLNATIESENAYVMACALRNLSVMVSNDQITNVNRLDVSKRPTKFVDNEVNRVMLAFLDEVAVFYNSRYDGNQLIQIIEAFIGRLASFARFTAATPTMKIIRLDTNTSDRDLQRFMPLMDRFLFFKKQGTPWSFYVFHFPGNLSLRSIMYVALDDNENVCFGFCRVNVVVSTEKYTANSLESLADQAVLIALLEKREENCMSLRPLSECNFAYPSTPDIHAGVEKYRGALEAIRASDDVLADSLYLWPNVNTEADVWGRMKDLPAGQTRMYAIHELLAQGTGERIVHQIAEHLAHEGGGILAAINVQHVALFFWHDKMQMAVLKPSVEGAQGNTFTVIPSGRAPPMRPAADDVPFIA